MHLKAIEEYILTQESEMASMERSIEASDLQKLDMQATIEELHARITEMKEDMGDMSKMIEASDKAKMEFQRQYETVRNQNAHLETQVTDLALDNAYFSMRNEELKAGSAELHDTLADMQRDFNDINYDIKDMDEKALREALVRAIRQTEQQHAKIRDLEQMNRSLFEEPHMRGKRRRSVTMIEV